MNLILKHLSMTPLLFPTHGKFFSSLSQKVCLNSTYSLVIIKFLYIYCYMLLFKSTILLGGVK